MKEEFILIRLLEKIQQLYFKFLKSLSPIHYINGPEILPAPLTKDEEVVVMENIRLGTPGAREPLITHNNKIQMS